MKKLMLVLATVIFLFSSVDSFGFSTAKYHYQVEYLKPGSIGVSLIFITVDTRTSPEVTERWIRRELINAIKYALPKNDIMAMVLYRNGEKGIKIPDGSRMMIYLHKTKQILTDKEWEKVRGW